MAKKLPPVHPGEILREEFLVPLKLTPYAVAAALSVPRTRIERIAREESPLRPTARCGSANSSRPALRSG
jgi:addiction module HigA family antidote